MAYEKRFQQLLSVLDPLDRPKARQLYLELSDKSATYYKNARKIAYINEFLRELSKKIGPYELESQLNPSEKEEIEKARRGMISERDTYQMKNQQLKLEIKTLVDDFKPYLEQIRKSQLRKAVKPLALILICLSVASLTFFNYQSIGGYFILTRSNAYKIFFSLILFLIIGAVGFWYWKKK